MASSRKRPNGKDIAVALSGGIDSVSLLHFLKNKGPVSAIHVHHGLSPNADAWAAFCRALCKRWGVPLTVRRVKVARNGKGLEAAAREARYNAFAKADADCIALAHNLDDQAETLLLQLLRGAGPKGLSAMPEVRGEARGERGEEKKGSRLVAPLAPLASRVSPPILRPLLDVPRSEIERYARRRKLGWIDDESNIDTAFDRNFLRHRVIPVIAQRYSSYRTTLARASRNLAEAAQLLDELAASDIALTGTGIAISGLRRLSAARAKNALRYFLASERMPMPNAARLDEYVRQIMEGKRGTRTTLDLGNQRLIRFGDDLRLVPVSVPPPAGFTRVWRGESMLQLSELGGTLQMTQRRGAGISLARLLAAPVSVRLRQGGERFQPDARRRRRTLKNLLHEARVPPWLRDRLPLLYSGATLVYVPGIGIDAAYLASAQELGVEPSWHGP